VALFNVDGMAASDDDRIRLLDSDDNEGLTSQLRRRKTPSVRGVTDVPVDDNRLLGAYHLTADNDASYSNRLRTIGDNDYVVAVFVVAFDTKAGPCLITWCCFQAHFCDSDVCVSWVIAANNEHKLFSQCNKLCMVFFIVRTHDE